MWLNFLSFVKSQSKIFLLYFLMLISLISILFSFAFSKADWEITLIKDNTYITLYKDQLENFRASLTDLSTSLNAPDSATIELLHSARFQMKQVDFLLRYLDPTLYKKVNGPLPVEWETEVFEKFEKPYKRVGGGLTLAEGCLDEISDNSRIEAKLLVQDVLNSLDSYRSDSLLNLLSRPEHLFFANRLYLLNLATIYTTGFECPDTNQIVPELKSMLRGVNDYYLKHNSMHQRYLVSSPYLELYQKMIKFVDNQPNFYSSFNHYTFIQDYVNPLFQLNQEFIVNYQLRSSSFVDYSLNKTAKSIFSKQLYNGQYTKGIYAQIVDPLILKDLEDFGKSLFFDPILSGNNERSCASCHRPDQGFTQTNRRTSVHMDGFKSLERNSISLINSQFNHLIMVDGVHTTLQDQAIGVMTNPDEMNSQLEDVLQKVLSCKDYKKTLKKFLKFTPQEPTPSIRHIASALTYYYGTFGTYTAPFDDAMNRVATVSKEVKNGFNLFMSRSQCATCHFAPQFNGVKPPYIGSEFEVLGVPHDSLYSKLDTDLGRAKVYPEIETKYAFRTGTLRNISNTAPYMHNGVFTTLNQVLEFYNQGGGVGRGFNLTNQTLSSEPLHLTMYDKSQLIAFMQSLAEVVPNQTPPQKLPLSKNKSLNLRKVGGTY
jgi:cytochrome c peroxidase